MAQRLWAFLIWAAVAAGVVFWALRLGVAPTAVPAGPAVAFDAAVPRAADLSRLLGAPPAAAAVAAPVPVAESARFRLLGVIAGGRAAGGGVALLVVDGKPPRAYRVGAPIDATLRVQSVTRRGVAIGAPGAPASVTLELPPPPAAATGEPLRLAPDGSVIGGAPGAAGLPPTSAAAPPPMQMPFPPPGMPGMPGMPLQPAAGANAPDTESQVNR